MRWWRTLRRVIPQWHRSTVRRVPIWVATLHISKRTAQKITELHQISESEIRDAVVGVAGLRATWHQHPERGWRALIEARVRGRRVLVVLYERPDPLGDAFNLGSAYFMDEI